MSIRSEGTDPTDALTKKVGEIFRKLVGERATRLDPTRMNESAIEAITAALARDYGSEKAAEIAFHMADWNGDAAFIVALHLFPERFTPDEIAEGICGFLVHAPHHIRAACALTGYCVWEESPFDDE